MASEKTPRRLVRIIWQNLWPVLGLMFLNFLVGYVDIFVAGLLGADVQAAVGFISQQYFILIIVGNALGVGMVALISQAAGQRQWDTVYSLMRQALILTGLLGTVLWASGTLGAPAILRRFSLPDSVHPLALSYLQIYSAALLPNYIIIVAGAVFRAVGKPLIAFQIMFIVAVFNIGANFGLVFGLGPLPRLGPAGIAWATVSAMFVGALCVFLVLSRSAWRPLWQERWSLSRDMVARIAKISWPAALLQVAWNAGNLAIYQILGHLGDQSITAMASYANGLRIEAITYLPAFALNMVAAVLIGQNLGAGAVEEARRLGWRMAAVGSLGISVFAAALFWAAPSLAVMLSSNDAVVAETIRYLRINLLVAPLMVFSMVLGGAMQGAGDTRGVMMVITIAIWIIRIPMAALFCFEMNLGALGVWLAMDASMVVQTTLMTWRFHRGGWALKRSGPS